MQSRFTRRARVAAAAIALLAAAATAPFTATATSIAPVTANQVATEMAELLKLHPTGIQVSDNALYFPDTETSVVWPNPGQTAAPAGLGSNLRPDALKRAGITSVAAQFGTQTVHGCPSGLTIKDYYCFYTEYNFGDRRLQFTGATKASDAATWNFDNQTRTLLTALSAWLLRGPPLGFAACSKRLSGNAAANKSWPVGWMCPASVR